MPEGRYIIRPRPARYAGDVAGVRIKRGVGYTDDPRQAHRCVLAGCECTNTETGITVPPAPAPRVGRRPAEQERA